MTNLFSIQYCKRCLLAVVLLNCVYTAHAFQEAVLDNAKAQEEPVLSNENRFTTENTDELVAGRFDVGEELVLTMIVDNYTLGDIFSIAQKGGLLIDFEAYVNFVDFPIKTNTQSRTYEGWFISRDKTFKLDLNDLSQPKLTINGIAQTVDPLRINFTDDVLYVEESLFNEWFNIKHEFKFNSLEMIIKPKTPLPFQQRLARANKTASKIGTNEAKFQELKRGYEILSPQVLDVQTNTTYRESSDSIGGYYSILGARDIAMMHSNFYFSGNDQDLFSNARVTLSKESLNNDLLGFLKASRIEAGDIQALRQGVSGGRSRGVSITNARLINDFDTGFINIIGPMQSGWDVEVYRNGVLLKQETAVERGEYSFLDIPLNVGMNKFEIIKYGPQGQIEKEFREKVVDRSLIEDSNLYYGLSFTESGKSLFGTEKVQQDFDGGYNLSGNVSGHLLGSSVSLGLQTIFGGDIAQNSASLNVNRPLTDTIFAGFTSFINDNNLVSVGTNLRGQLWGQSFNVSYTKSQRTFDDPALQSADSDSLRLGLSGGFKLSNNSRLSYDNEFSTQNSNTSKRTEVNNRLGFNAGNYSLYNSLQYVDQTILGKNTQSLIGNLSTQTVLGTLFMRFGLNYDLQNSFEIRALTTDLSWSISNSLKAKLNADFSPITSDYNLRSSFGIRNTNYGIYTNIDYSSVSGFTLGVNVNFSLSGQPLIYGDVFQTERRIATSATLSVRVFEDINANGIFDMGEPLIPNVKVISKQSIAISETDALGMAVLTGLTHNKLSDVTIDTDTLPDHTLVPLIEGIAIRFRRGIADKLDFPLARTLEIEGTVNALVNEVITPLSKVPLKIYDGSHKLVAETTTEYDGYYIIEKLFDGKYSIEIDQDYLMSKRLVFNEPVYFDVKAVTGDFLYKDIILKKLSSVEGYISLLGQFPSEKMLNLYLKLNRNKLKNFNGSINTINLDNVFTLIAGFNEQADQLGETCLSIQMIGLKCEVLPFTHYY